jgi:hypothetical protein
MRRGLLELVSGVLLLGLCAAGLPGCEDQEAPRSLVYVSRIAESPTEQNSYGHVFLSDLVTDGSIIEDEIYVSFTNVPRSDHLSIEPGGPFGSVTLTDYRVDYHVTGPEIEAIQPVTGKIHVVIPSGEEVNHRIVLVTAEAKVNEPLYTTGQTLLAELMAEATLTFTGYEETSEEPITVRAYMTIHFANWTDEE